MRCPDWEHPLGEARQRPRVRKLAEDPPSPRSHTDRRREQRVVGVCELDCPVHPAGRMVTGAQVHQLGQRRDQTKRRPMSLTAMARSKAARKLS